MTIRTIAANWRRFEQLVLDPVHASTQERRRARLTYYAGIAAMFDLVAAIGTDEYSEEAGVEQMEAISRELTEFAQFERAFAVVLTGKGRES